LFTTSNFPDILFPYWKVNNLTAIYFIGFLLIGLYMLLNLMLSVFYNSYKHQFEKKIEKYDNMRREFLQQEFTSIAGHPDERITSEEFREKYGNKLIKSSRKVSEILTSIENEQELGISDGLINFEDFSYMYMFLEFKDIELSSGKSKDADKKGKPRRSSTKKSRESQESLLNSDGFEDESEYIFSDSDSDVDPAEEGKYQNQKLAKPNRRKRKSKLQTGLTKIGDGIQKTTVGRGVNQVQSGIGRSRLG